MKKISALVVVIGFIMIMGIVGGVEHGEPLTNILWCIPCFIVVCIFAKLGGLID